MLSPKIVDTTEKINTKSESDKKPSVFLPGHKLIRRITVIILIIIVVAECVCILVVETDIEETVLDTYRLTDEDAAQWSTAAEQIVEIITDKFPYYASENCVNLSEEEKQAWQEKCYSFAGQFLETETLQPVSARDMAGQRYIKSYAVHSLIGDDTCFGEKNYIPFARLSKLKVKLLDYPYDINVRRFSIWGYDFWVIGEEYSEEEEAERNTLYKQIAVNYPDFFKIYDEPLLQHCFYDMALSMEQERE